MALVNQTLKLEITPGGVPPKLHVTEYDENMQIVAQLFQRGQHYEIPSGTTAKVEGTLAGHPFSADATVDGSNVTFELTKGMTAYAGRAWTKIKLTQNSKPVSTCGFWLECDRAGVEAETVIGAPGFEEQIADAAAEWMEQQGFTSPTVSVAPITGGNRVTFTDKDGTETMYVMNGKDGEKGAPGKDGAPGIYYGTTQPTGDTHPVWIDPGGDHDDGGLLPAVTAADNGKVLRVVNSAWPAEDMPTGGADMGITGAAVGQIAKITAVDDTGKPTAWEAVDMPEQVQPDWNQNDSTAADYVKNRPFYSETKTVTFEDVTSEFLKGFPAFVTGDTVNVNVDGVEHSLVAYYDESEGVFTIGDIYSSLENGEGQLGWQFWSNGESDAYFYATEAHTISYLGVFIYKIDDKFLNLDGLVRTYNYHFKNEWLYKTLYNSAGDECLLYTCSDFILPALGSQLFGFMNELGFSIVDSVDLYSCFITGVIISTMSARIRIVKVVLGTDTSHMETMAADNGYTYTTNPNA